jgi:hypothetical protein
VSAGPPLGPFVPQGMPPGTEYGALADRAPDGIYYFRIYGGIQAVLHGLVTLAGLGMMFVPLWAPASAGAGGTDVGVWIVMGLFYGGMGLVFLVPTLIALFGGRRPWVHVVGTVVIAMGMLSICCIPVLIPLLLVWMKPETRAWYGAR